MSYIRRVALTISQFVVEHASPGCKEWAEGLARETESIEDDWTALRWALGSMRVLLDRREAPIATLDEFPSKTQRLLDRLSDLRVVGFSMFLNAATQLLSIAPRLDQARHGHGVQQVWGHGLAFLGMIYMGIFPLVQARTEEEPEGYDADWIGYYRSQLVRLRNLHTSSFGRIYPLAIFLTFLGLALAIKVAVGTAVLLVLGSVLTLWLLSARAEHAYQRRLDRLDFLLRQEKQVTSDCHNSTR